MDPRIESIAKGIETLKSTVEGLRQLGGTIPALERNCARIAASVKMLEINFTDPLACERQHPSDDFSPKG